MESNILKPVVTYPENLNRPTIYKVHYHEYSVSDISAEVSTLQ